MMMTHKEVPYVSLLDNNASVSSYFDNELSHVPSLFLFSIKLIKMFLIVKRKYCLVKCL